MSALDDFCLICYAEFDERVPTCSKECPVCEEAGWWCEAHADPEEHECETLISTMRR